MPVWFQWIVVGVSSIAATAGLWKWLGQKWVEQRLAINLEKFKAEQQREMERLRHFLSSRISKIHEKEFEVLPKAWFMLNELHGCVALAVDLTLKTSPNFHTLPDAEFEEFLKSGPASRLADYQKTELRNGTPTFRQQYYREEMAAIYLDDAREKHRVFQNYLIENSIFMTDELRKNFDEANTALSSALADYTSGRYGKNPQLERSAQITVSHLRDAINKVEQSVQKRLHYEEA
jgi:hypothetical protein